MMWRCHWCELPILSAEPPRCRKCNKPVCDPRQRDCGVEHFKARHLPKPVKDIEGGLDRLTPGEKTAHAEGTW